MSEYIFLIRRGDPPSFRIANPTGWAASCRMIPRSTGSGTGKQRGALARSLPDKDFADGSTVARRGTVTLLASGLALSATNDTGSSTGPYSPKAPALKYITNVARSPGPSFCWEHSMRRACDSLVASGRIVSVVWLYAFIKYPGVRVSVTLPPMMTESESRSGPASTG